MEKILYFKELIAYFMKHITASHTEILLFFFFFFFGEVGEEVAFYCLNYKFISYRKHNGQKQEPQWSNAD